MLEHGGNLRAAALKYARPLSDWLDLSAGLNPHWYPVPPLDGAAWHRLPETDPELAQAAARYYGAPQMLAVAGTQAAIAALPRLRAPSRVVVAAPSYAEHAHHWAQHGHTLRQLAYADLDGAVSECDVLVVCNPNNPTGAVVAPQQLRLWAAALAARGGWLVVDEAFGDTAPELSVAASSGQTGLIVLRSLGKFFGLAGLRMGFVGAHPDLLDALADLLGHWTVSGPAQVIARAALDDRDWQRDMHARLVADSARLMALLREVDIAAHGCALFCWWPEAQPEAFAHHMAERGIWVRLFVTAGRGIRLGLPSDQASWQRLTLALIEWKRKQQ